jgi:hypothetical protein
LKKQPSRNGQVLPIISEGRGDFEGNNEDSDRDPDHQSFFGGRGAPVGQEEVISEIDSKSGIQENSMIHKQEIQSNSDNKNLLLANGNNEDIDPNTSRNLSEIDEQPVEFRQRFRDNKGDFESADMYRRRAKGILLIL